MIEYLKTVDWNALSPFLTAYPLFVIGFVFLVLRWVDDRQAKAAARAIAARRRALEHGARRGWDCPKPGPIHYIPEGVTKGGRRVP